MNIKSPKKLDLSPTSTQQQSNMMTSLQHRIDVAKAKHDHRLLKLLRNERTQLKSRWRQAPSLTLQMPRLAQLWQRMARSITSRTQLSIERRITAKGEEWWHVADPRSGKTFNAESFGVAMHWIEQNRLGH
ncbi:hypothetical protein [Acaryochloris sp. IP29b_bin.137]|uniref:hypothetical protein n=1 Tax=Acaryochloris sp. IP29b_bin.137 TaxID=2969217 RepID=UPI00262F07D7|nr:hypothetical protein [Acaryochloris sp. IP29b_bin.137]